VCSTLWFACWAKIASLAVMNEEGSCCDEVHTFFYDACFLLNKADGLCQSIGRPFASLEDSCAAW